MPFRNYHQETLGGVVLLLRGPENHTAHLGPHSHNEERERETREGEGEGEEESMPSVFP